MRCWEDIVRDKDSRIEELVEACEFALSYFESAWGESDNHPHSHYAEYVDVLSAATARGNG